MQRYIVMRLVQGILTLLILSLAVFLSVHLTGDPALYLLGPEGTQQDYEQLKKNLGLDKPLPVQYASFLVDIVRGDFGTSHITGQPARKTLIERFPATLELAELPSF
jgi:peptide/nickel transport system permease protein